MNTIEYQQNELIISTDKARLDIPLIHEFLSERSYWAKGRSLDVVRLSSCNGLRHIFLVV